MSHDLLKSINQIKISVNENDQVLWECQAAEKCYNEATEKLKDECDRLNYEIKKIDEEIKEIEPQIKTLAANYDGQIESIVLNQQSLINQRLYKISLREKIKKNEEETHNVVDEYAEYIKKSKEKLEYIKPTYKILQLKKTKLRQSKCRCMVLLQSITELKNINKQNMEMKQKLFYNDIIRFAHKWVNKKKYLEIRSHLEEDTKKEKEYLHKLADVTQKLKQKQMDKSRQPHNYNVPKIEFPLKDIYNMGTGKMAEKDKTQETNRFTNIQKLLEKQESAITSNLKRNELQKIKSCQNNSKVRILENKTLTVARNTEKFCNSKSEKERSKEITAKIQKVVQNFNKTISRQNSKRSVKGSSQKSQIVKQMERPSSQQSNVNQECQRIDLNQSLQHSQRSPYKKNETIQVTQNLNLSSENIKKPDMSLFKKGPNLQFPNKQLYQFNAENGISIDNRQQRFSNENCQNNKPSQEPIGKSSSTNKEIGPTENVTHTEEKKSQINTSSINKMRIYNLGEKISFNMSTSVDKPDYPPFLAPPDQNTNKNENMFQYTSLETPGMPNKSNYEMEMSDYYDDVFKSPNFCSPQEENNVNLDINFSGVPNFSTQPLFSFGEFLN